MRVSVSEHIFFLIADGKFCVWDFYQHQQFEMSESQIVCLLRCLASGEASEEDECVREMMEAGLLNARPNDELPLWKWDVLSKIFHVGTANARLPDNQTPGERSRAYVERCDAILADLPSDAFSHARGEETLDLPELAPPLRPDSLSSLLSRRMTSRSFSGEGVGLDSMSRILTETFGYRPHLKNKFESKGLTTLAMRRSSPSGGSLQCSEAYLVAANVHGLDRGIYHFRSHENSLARVSSLGPHVQFGTDYLEGQTFADDADAFIVITTRFDKMWWKYPHSRAYRVSCMDVGHLSQTAQLIATEQGVRTWLTAAFNDFELRALLKIEKQSPEFPMLVLGFGTGEVDPVDSRYTPR